MTLRRVSYSRRQRLRLFLRDWTSEWGIAWSLARTNDCERSGGHYWRDAAYDENMKSWGLECSRCGCWQSVPETSHTGSLTIYPGQTTGLGA